MGTRGAFGFVIDGEEKIGYNQFDSYPSYHGVKNLMFLRQAQIDELRESARALRVVDDSVKPTPEDIAKLKPITDLGVASQSDDDWYCLTRDSHGSFELMLACGYVEDNRSFPLDSLFCEWAYLVDLDAGVFEVYKGFRTEFPQHGRWANRPTDEETEEAYQRYVEACKANGVEPRERVPSEYKAVELIASFPLDKLPTEAEFIEITEPPEEDDDG